MIPARQFKPKLNNYKKSKQVTKKWVKKQIEKDVEHKVITRSLRTSFGSVSTSWTEVDLSTMPAGTSSGLRIGRKVKLTSLEINGILGPGASETLLDDAYNVFRIRIATYEGGGAPMTAASIALDQPVRHDLSTAGPNLIKTYMDKYVPLNVAATEKGGGDGYAASLRKFKYYKKFKNPIEITFADETATYPNKRLIMSCLSDSGAAVNPGFSTGWILLRYTDE